MKFDIPAYALTANELWTPALVRDALVDALLVLRALPGQAGPASMAAYWPEYRLDYYREEQNRTRRRPNAEDITHMHRFLVGVGSAKGWINGPVMIYPEQRSALLQWARWVAMGCSAPDGVVETEQEFCNRIGQRLTSLQRRRDFAAGIIAEQANREKIVVWYVERPTRRRKREANYHAAGG